MKKTGLFIVLSIGIFGILSFTSDGDRYFEIAKNLDIFATLFKEVNALYVDEINPNELVRVGIDQMLASLDPYTNYIPEDEVEDYRTSNTGQYGGIGAITRDVDGRTMVSMIMEGFSAHQTGLKIGDEIIKINDIPMSTLSREEANQLMKGQIGTTLNITIKRKGTEEPITLNIKREKIKISNVPFSGMFKNMGYIQLSDFTPDAGKEVKNAMESLIKQGAKGIILDLRGNPGGLLMEAVNITNLFIPKGMKVVSTRGKVPENNLSYETLNTPVDTDIRVAVLIDRGSASASEIVSGTLQDYDRAVIIGEKSFGKGLVQMSRPLSYNAQLKITTAKYYTPTGRCIQVLDYSSRRDDGSVGSVPDSLKQPFQTTNGRTVFDGGGIDPDIKTNHNDQHEFVKLLERKGFILDFVSEYMLTLNAEPNPREYVFPDQDYPKFVGWMNGKNYSYRSQLEESLEEFEAKAKEERYYTDIEAKLQVIRAKVIDAKKKELELYKEQIRKLLTEEVISRYHLTRGVVESQLSHDQDIDVAVEILSDPIDYAKLLNAK